MADSVEITIEELSANAKVLKFAWVAAGGGGLTAVTTGPSITAQILGWSITLGITDPGDGVPPTDNYSISLKDDFGMDVFGSELGSRDEANTEQVIPKIDTVYGARIVGTALTFDVTGNSVSSATGDLYVYLER